MPCPLLISSQSDYLIWCNSLSCPLGSLPPGVSCHPPPPTLDSLPPTPVNLANSIQNDIYIYFFITNLYHTIIRTVVMYVFRYFSVYGRRLGLRYCSLSISLPNSEVLADTVQKGILSLLIEFPIEQVIRESAVFDITYFSSNRKGRGGKIPWPGQLAPPPPPPTPQGEDPLAWAACPHPWKLDKLRSEKLFNHFKLKILMHRH